MAASRPDGIYMVPTSDVDTHTYSQLDSIGAGIHTAAPSDDLYASVPE